MRSRYFWGLTGAGTAGFALAVVVATLGTTGRSSRADGLHSKHEHTAACAPRPAPVVGEGNWMWVREPEQERRVMASIFNRYCIRCHGADARGVYDVPDIPNFVDACWQDTRPDDYIAQVLDLGRGACMPSFRGTLNYEEYWAMARYLRTFDPRRQAPRPSNGQPDIRPGANPQPVNTPPPALGAAPSPEPAAPPPPPVAPAPAAVRPAAPVPAPAPPAPATSR
jgi:hypothetical protein